MYSLSGKHSKVHCILCGETCNLKLTCATHLGGDLHNLCKTASHGTGLSFKDSVLDGKIHGQIRLKRCSQ